MPPIQPNQVKKFVPEEVFECFNKLIAQNLAGDSSTVKQEDVVKLLVEKGFSEKEIFDKHMLDIEGEYKKAGWDVDYDKPGYNENYYPPFFVFSHRKKS